MEVTPITRQNYLGELKKLLAGMTNADREATLARYDAMFEEANGDEDLIARLGSPTFVALGELRGYVRPEGEEEPEPPAPMVEEEEPALIEPSRRMKALTAEDVEAARAAMSERTAATKAAPAPELNIPRYSPPEEEPRPELSKGKLVLYILCAFIFGVPLTVLLVLVSLAILALGAGLCAAGVFIISLGFLGMDIFVDLMLLFGAGLIVAALGLPIVFFSVWFFIRVVVGFLNWIISSGERWCEVRPLDREVDEDYLDEETPEDFPLEELFEAPEDFPLEEAFETPEDEPYIPPELPEADGDEPYIAPENPALDAGYEPEEDYPPQDGAPDDCESYQPDEEEEDV